MMKKLFHGVPSEQNIDKYLTELLSPKYSLTFYTFLAGESLGL